MGVLDVLRFSIEVSPVSHAMLLDGKAIAIYGVGQLTESAGSPWLIGTTDIARIPGPFARFTREGFKEFAGPWRYLENYVDDRNEASKKWLAWLGFLFDEPAPYGVEGRPFRRFYMVT